MRLRTFSAIPTSLRVFITNVCSILSNASSASAEMMVQSFFFHLLIWWITLIDREVLNQPLIPRINLTWLWYRVLFTFCWVLFVNIFLRGKNPRKYPYWSFFIFFPTGLLLFTSQILQGVASLLRVVHPGFHLESVEETGRGSLIPSWLAWEVYHFFYAFFVNSTSNLLVCISMKDSVHLHKGHSLDFVCFVLLHVYLLYFFVFVLFLLFDYSPVIFQLINTHFFFLRVTIKHLLLNYYTKNNNYFLSNKALYFHFFTPLS